jgi:hypothetical protein
MVWQPAKWSNLWMIDVCVWPKCPWLLYASKNSKSDGRRYVATSVDIYTCPLRTYNKLVTSRIIADKYDSLIRANSTWKVEMLSETVCRHFFWKWRDIRPLCWSKIWILQKESSIWPSDWGEWKLQRCLLGKAPPPPLISQMGAAPHSLIQN